MIESREWTLINDYHHNTSRNTNPTSSNTSTSRNTDNLIHTTSPWTAISTTLNQLSSTTNNSTNTSTMSSVNSTTIVDITNTSSSFPGYPHLATSDVAILLRSAPMNISNLSANSSIIDLTADTITGNITISIKEQEVLVMLNQCMK